MNAIANADTGHTNPDRNGRLTPKHSRSGMLLNSSARDPSAEKTQSQVLICEHHHVA
jgi:hypothetical protein